MSVKVVAPVSAAAESGENVTLTVQFDPAARVEVQVVVSEKFPVVTMLVIFSVADPVFVKVRT